MTSRLCQVSPIVHSTDAGKIPHKMPVEEYKLFTEKMYFTIRRTDKFWDGIFSEQTIEQFLMRQLKSLGGMTQTYVQPVNSKTTQSLY